MKKYYLFREENEFGGRDLIAAEEEDFTVEIELAGLVYVLTRDIDNIEEYHRAYHDNYSDVISENEATEYTVLNLEDLTADEKYYFIDPPGLEIDGKDVRAIEKSIVEKMKKDGVSATDLETCTYYDDGRKRHYVEHGYIDIQWIDYTDELQGMRKLDSEEYRTGTYELYETDGYKNVLIDYTRYANILPTLYFVKSTTIEDALREIGRED